MNLKSSLCAVALVLAAVTFTKCTAPATADQLHKEEKWAKAVDKLIDDLAKEKNDARKAQMTYMIAENYMGLRKYDLAAQWYENAEKVNYAEAHPELLLKLLNEPRPTISDIENCGSNLSLDSATVATKMTDAIRIALD